jgi:hypothetical protein
MLYSILNHIVPIHSPIEVWAKVQRTMFFILESDYYYDRFGCWWFVRYLTIALKREYNFVISSKWPHMWSTSGSFVRLNRRVFFVCFFWSSSTASLVQASRVICEDWVSNSSISGWSWRLIEIRMIDLFILIHLSCLSEASFFIDDVWLVESGGVC